MNTPAVRPVAYWEIQRGILGGYTVRYSCPHCASKLNAPIDDAGKAHGCPDCAAIYLLPDKITHEVNALLEEQEQNRIAQEKQKKLAQEEERRRRQARQEAANADQERRRQQEEAARARENAARAASEMAAATNRQHYMQRISSEQRKFKVVLVDSAQEAERACNHMGFDGWELEQSFTDTFTYHQCCNTEHKRQFVLIFSQRLDLTR